MYALRTTLPLAAATVVSLFALAGPALADDHGRARDRDHDGMPDRWEHRYHVSRPGLDPDHDRLSNLVEYRLGTNPRRADTDGDGVRDGQEDTDHDGLTNAQEDRAGTNPVNGDTDHDGVRDGREHSGTVTSFEGGAITIALAGGGSLTARVTPSTEITCESRSAYQSNYASTPPAPTAHAASHGGPGDQSGPGPGSGGGSGGHGADSYVTVGGAPQPSPDAGTTPATTPASTTPAGGYPSPGYDDNPDQQGTDESCAPDQIVGATVREAEVEPTPDGLVLDRLELVIGL